MENSKTHKLHSIIDLERYKKGKTKKQVSENVGRTRSFLWKTIKQGSVQFNILEDICNYLDCDIIIRDSDGKEEVINEK